MLNLNCFHLLADRRRITDGRLRFFMALIRDYDLRSWRALRIPELAAAYGQGYQYPARGLATLVDLGILELGPPMQDRPTFRIAPRYLLQGRDLENWFHEIETVRQLDTLAPTEDRPGATPSTPVVVH